MERVLITGGAGYIGTMLSQMLANSGYIVTIADNLMYGQGQSLLSLMSHPSINFVKLDVRDTKKLQSLTIEHDIIIPLACLVGAPLCKERPQDAWDINANSIKKINEVSGDRKILYPTTNSGYGVGGDGYCDETYPLNPISVYGETKVAAEKTVIESGGIAFRLATVFGASFRMRMDLLVNDFTWKAKRDGVLVLFESHFRRNYIHVLDVCRAFRHAIENYDTMGGEVYNVGLSSANLTKLELANVVKKLVPNTVIIESAVGSDPDKRDYVVSNEKLEATGWKPIFTLEQGIEEVCKIYDVVKASGDVYRNY